MGQPVFGVDLVDLEEAVLARAVAHEGSLQVGVDVVDDTLVDIALEFALVEHVQVVFLQTAFLGDGHFHLFAGQHADEHAPLARGHLGFDRGRTHAALLGGFAVLAATAGTGRGVFQAFHITGGSLPQFFITEIVRQVGGSGRFGALLGVLVGGLGTFRLGLTVLAVASASAATAATALAAGLLLAVFLAARVSSGSFTAFFRGDARRIGALQGGLGGRCRRRPGSGGFGSHGGGLIVSGTSRGRFGGLVAAFGRGGFGLLAHGLGRFFSGSTLTALGTGRAAGTATGRGVLFAVGIGRRFRSFGG